MSDADRMRQAMLVMSEAFEPVREWAKGQREALLRDGWSAAAADQIAAELTIGVIQKIMAAN